MIVTAKDQQTKLQQSITIQGSSTLDEQEIDRMVANAEAFAKADKEKRDLVETKNNADALVYQTQKQLDELGDQLPNELKTKIQTLVDGLKSELQSGNLDLLKSKMEELQSELTQLSNIANNSNTDNTTSADQ